ncbi:uncharacterized protein LOC129716727 [Wyeomyia smithii]|uniref:uncharacterized protein LOC129716727 n=1 Tax=Wyeomyia smithii TaxID=174621 RepID=UPI00246811D3|nr:uncharacterized protein LOC129716727 [Wyeomyia smithii]
MTTKKEDGESSSQAVKLIGTLENFIPSADFDDYFERAENFFELNDIKDNTFKQKLIVHYIGLPAMKKLQQLLYPKTHKEVTYEEVIEKLKSCFSPKKNRIAQSVEFFKRTQNEFEKVADFAVEIQALSKHCEFGEFLDKALRDKFIAGLSNAKIQGDLLNSSDDTTFEKAVTVAENLEQIEADMMKMKSKQEYANRINAGQYSRRSRSKTGGQEDGKRSQHRSPAAWSQSKRKTKNRDKKDLTCYNCGKRGHFARNCWGKRNMNGLMSSDDEGGPVGTNSEAEMHHVANHPLFRKI